MSTAPDTDRTEFSIDWDDTDEALSEWADEQEEAQ